MNPGSKWSMVPTILLCGLFLSAGVSAQTRSVTQRSKKKVAQVAFATASDVQELRAAIAAQQQQIQQLVLQLQQQQAAFQQAQQQSQQQLQQTQAAAADAQAKASSLENAGQDKDSKLSSDVTDLGIKVASNAAASKEQEQRVKNVEGVLGRFRFTGDVRVRGESFFQNCSGCAQRNRARVRARFGFDSKLNEDFTAGVFLATGSLADLTSANETLTNFFDRKTIGLDRAFITYHPVKHPWLEATGGKWAFTWNRTSLTFDPDINPEGFSEKLSWKLKNTGALKNFSVGAMQLLYNEISAGTDSYALGGQASSTFELGPWTATPQFVALKWNNPSAILQANAFAVQATKATDSGGGTINLPGEGPGCANGTAGSDKLPAFAPCALASNGMTNAVFTDPLTGAPRLLSGYFNTDYILNNVVKTGIERLPFNLLLEFQQNLDAANHPLDSKGKVITGLGPQNMGYMVDAGLGQSRNKNDVQFGYAFWRQEQDAILATFSESEQRASTNVLQHRIYARWKLRSNTLAEFNLWRGRTLNTGLENNAALNQKTIKAAGDREPYLNRYQFDLIYSF